MASPPPTHSPSPSGSLLALNPRPNESNVRSESPSGSSAKDLSSLKYRFRKKNPGQPVSAYLSPSSPSSEPRLSCVRCRRLKKKCDKQVPECSSCASSSDVCSYVPRQRRASKYQAAQASPTDFTEEVAVPPSPAFHTSVLYAKSLEPAAPAGPVVLKQKLGSPRPTGTILLSKVDFKNSSHNTPAARRALMDSLNSPKTKTFVEAYFKHIHRAYPFINEPEFMADFDRIDFTRLDIYSGTFKFKVFMVMTIGCTALERANILHSKSVKPQAVKFSESLFDVSLTFINNDCTGIDTSTITQLLLLGLYAYYDPTEFSSWEITGKLVRSAVSVGLNKKLTPKQARSLSPVQIEMRSRLFWSIYIMDRLVSVSLGRPVGIQDQDISTPLPSTLPGEQGSIDTTLAVINLRRLEGVILCRVHSIRSEMLTAKEKDDDITELRAEIDDWFAKAQGRLSAQTSSQRQFSFHGSLPWIQARYHHLLILLYVPSHLQPKPSPESLAILGKSCLEALSCTYDLFKKSMLPLNWITLYRFLTICTAILHCLCKWSIDFQGSTNEVHYCVEILRAFSSDWHVAKRCAEVFESIENKMLDISIGSASSKDLKMDTLLNELWGTSSSYHQILMDSTVDLVLDNAFFDVFGEPLQPEILN